METMDSIPVITTTNPKSRIGGKAHDHDPTPHTVRVTTATTEMVSPRAHEVSGPLQPVTAVEGISITHDHDHLLHAQIIIIIIIIIIMIILV